MPLHLITLKSPLPYHGTSMYPILPQNRTLAHPISLPIPRSVLSCKGVGIQVSSPERGSGSANGVVRQDWKLRGVGVKDVDVATLGNLCVDIVLSVPQLPPKNLQDRKAYMDRLSASPPDKQYWEAGGNCNMAIAAARLGLRCVTIGHVGSEVYGKFLLDVLHDEGISIVGMSEDSDVHDGPSASYETLLCWVLVDSLQRHGFCSRADFSKEPAFSWLSRLSAEVQMAIKKSKILFCNGYGFDELSPNMITSAIEYAVEVGTSVFFDPGPRGRSLQNGTPEEQRALGQFLRMSDVLLLTSDEVHVIDTVGCGDSFVAAIAFGFINSMPMISSLALANAVGAATAMGCGAGRNVATLEKVMELMKVANLNVDDKFWNELLSENLDTREITFLSKFVVNGNNNRVKLNALQKVISELLPELESSGAERKVLS